MKTALFTLLNTLCLNFGSERLYASEGSVSLLGNLLSSHELAALWLEKSDSGIKSFYMQAVKLFPCHYQSLSTLMESLIGLNYDTHSVSIIYIFLHNLLKQLSFVEFFDFIISNFIKF